MAAVQCPACGVANRAHSASCRMCGDALPGTETASPRKYRKILRRTDFVAAARANQRATNGLALLLTAIAGVLGYLLGWSLQLSIAGPPAGVEGIVFLSRWGVLAGIALIAISIVWTLVALSKGDKIVLRLNRARAVPRSEAPQLHNVVEEMAIAAGVSKPTVYVMETAALNAFATGVSRKRSAIVVTRGLLDALNRDELQGVIAHEMGHIVNLDMRYATAVGVTVGLVVLVADLATDLFAYGGLRRGWGGLMAGLVMLLFALVAPLFARLVQMAVSRQREFLADATSVRLTRNPHGLISALEKLAGAHEPLPGHHRATQHLYIVNPLRNFTERTSRLWATHPPIERRIARLRNLGG